MKLSIALLPFIVAVLTSFALAILPPRCSIQLRCSGDAVELAECAAAGYICDGQFGPPQLVAGYTPNATCEADCVCTIFCGADGVD
ncbi:hypothetical protein FB451DRAFT_1239874 [Mycena latifolia]|nr:hypothetical protein FB451DRAFT_1239874 [Mycena latifolia]